MGVAGTTQKMAVCLLLPIDAQTAGPNGLKFGNGGGGGDGPWFVGGHGRKKKLYKMPFSGCHKILKNAR